MLDQHFCAVQAICSVWQLTNRLHLSMCQSLPWDTPSLQQGPVVKDDKLRHSIFCTVVLCGLL